jgi:hypothetical protein
MKISLKALIILSVSFFIFQSCTTDEITELKIYDLKGQNSKGNIVFIPDTNFRNTLININCVDSNGDGLPDSTVDLNNNGEIEKKEANSVENLILDFDYGSPITYVDLAGIENFTNIKVLKISGTGLAYMDEFATNDENMNYDFTSLRKLETLEIHYLGTEYFDTLNLSGLSKLSNLILSANRPLDYYTEKDQFLTVNMEGCSNLKYLNIANSFLNIDFCQIPSLEKLNMYYLEGGEPETFDFHCLTNLKWLDISENVIRSLVLKNNSVLETFIYDGGYEEMGWWYPSPNYICLDNMQEEYDQLLPLIGDNTIVTTDCNF